MSRDRTDKESSQISRAGLGGVVSGPSIRHYGRLVPSFRPRGEVVGPVFVRMWGRDAVMGRGWGEQCERNLAFSIGRTVYKYLARDASLQQVTPRRPGYYRLPVT